MVLFTEITFQQSQSSKTLWETAVWENDVYFLLGFLFCLSEKSATLSESHAVWMCQQGVQWLQEIERFPFVVKPFPAADLHVRDPGLKVQNRCRTTSVSCHRL